ncbi:MAG: hypothetical protein M3320_06140 [Actinomycetota bacterium]|nr:hypothetical protein [Actinomycetota bacterium]
MNLAALAAAALAGFSSPVEEPRAPTVRCEDRSEGAFPPFASGRNLVVGPLALAGAGALTPEETVREFGGNKFPALVLNRHRVTVQVVSGGARLTHGPRPDGPMTLEEGDRTMTFVACRRRLGSRAGRRRVTFWSGFVLTPGPQCVTLRVWVDRSRLPRRAAIPLGRECPA